MPNDSNPNVATNPLPIHSAQDTQPNGDSTALFEQLVREAGRQVDPPSEDVEHEAALARLLALPIPATAPIPMATVPIGSVSRRRIGQYELLDRIAGGGMGEVFRARHLLLDRVVAIKLIRPDHQLNPAAIERFKQEILALGRLQHPQIVAALDANEHEGLPYLVMEFVEGRPLSTVVETAQANGRPLPISEACEYVRQAALGLQAAHDRGVVHRDVKPSNLIVDGSGVVKILDLGLAKATEALGRAEPSKAAAELTREGQVMGTPDYMAPEQLRDSRRVDARTDVYALGATLFKLLTGRAPFADDAHRTPESKILAIGTELPSQVTTLRADVPAELGTLVGRMLAKDRDARPATASDVARQLERFCVATDADGRVVTPARRTMVSHRSPRSWASIAVALLAGLCLLAVVLVLRTPQGEILVELGEGVSKDIRLEFAANGRILIADKSNDFQMDAAATDYVVKIPGGDDRFTLDKHSVTVERNQLARLKVTLKPVPAADTASPQSLSWKPGQVEKRFPGLIRCPAKLQGIKHWQVTTLIPHAAVKCLAWHPSREWLAMGLGNGEVRIYDMAGDRFELLYLMAGHSGSIISVDWHVGGETLATGAEDATIRIWKLDASPDSTDANRNFTCRILEQHENVVRAVAWSPDGSTLASGSSDGSVRLWEDDLAKNRILTRQQSQVWKVAWNANGDRLAIGCLDGIVRIMRPDGTEEGSSWQGARAEPHELAFHHLGRHLVTCGFKPEVFVRDRTENQTRVLFTAPGHVSGAAIDRSRHNLAVVGSKLWIWSDWQNDPKPREIPLIEEGPSAVAWSANGQRLALGGVGGSLYEWNDQTRQLTKVFLEGRRVAGVAWNPEGTRLATGSDDGRLRIWSREGRLIASRAAHTGAVHAVSWSPDGGRIATGGSWPIPGNEPDYSLRLWSADHLDQPPVRFDSVGLAIHDLSWTPDGQRVVIGTASPTAGERLIAFNTLTGRRERSLLGHADEVMAVACHPDGKRIAAAGVEGKILLSNLSGDEPPAVLAEGLEGPVIGLAWDADGQRLAFTCQTTSRSIGLVDLARKQIVWHTKAPYRPGDISWSADGSKLVVGLTGVLSAETGDLIDPLAGQGRASAVAWSRGGLIAGNDFQSNSLSVFDPSHPDKGGLALLIGDRAASFTTAGELIDASSDVKSQLRYHVETDDGTVSLMSHEEFSSLCHKIGQVSKPDAP